MRRDKRRQRASRGGADGERAAPRAPPHQGHEGRRRQAPFVAVAGGPRGAQPRQQRQDGVKARVHLPRGALQQRGSGGELSVGARADIEIKSVYQCISVS